MQEQSTQDHKMWLPFNGNREKKPRFEKRHPRCYGQRLSRTRIVDYAYDSGDFRNLTFGEEVFRILKWQAN